MSSTNGQLFEILISFMEKNVGIAKNLLNAPQYKETTHHLWNEVTQQLNSAGPPEKSIEGWKKVWKDFKYSVKNKLRANKKYLTGTGGGPYKMKKIGKQEERVDRLLDLTGEIEGLKVKTFGCKVSTTPRNIHEDDDDLTLSTEEFEAEILHELNSDEFPINKSPVSSNRNIIEPIASTNHNRSTNQSVTHSVGGNTLSSRAKRKQKETTKMILKRQVEIQQKHFDNFQKFTENSEKHQKDIIKVLKDIRNLQKDKWIEKKKILLHKNKLKAEELELKRKELELKEQELNAKK